MAYKNIVGIAMSDTTDVFCYIRDYVCSQDGSGAGRVDYSVIGLGWTLFDFDYTGGTAAAPVAGNWFVMKTTGEGADDEQYVYIELDSTTNYLASRSFMFWDVAGNVGYIPAGTGTATNGVYVGTGTSTLWIYGDLTSVAIVTKVTTTSNYYASLFGKAESVLRADAVLNLSGAETAGSSVIMGLDATLPVTNWAVGDYIYIWDPIISGPSERVIIEGVAASEITVTTLANNYSAGAHLSANPGYYGAYSGNNIGAGVHLPFNLTASAYITGYVGKADLTGALFLDDLINKVTLSTAYLYSTGTILWGKFRNMVSVPIPSGNWVNEDVATDQNAVDWRLFDVEGNIYLGFKEV